ncbi:hypothetical protein AAIR98_001256 [Elusimicrobium simillimum]
MFDKLIKKFDKWLKKESEKPCHCGDKSGVCEKDGK